MSHDSPLIGRDPMLSGDGEPVYLSAGGETSFAVLHRAARPLPVAVLLIPPFGWEEIASYRPRRFWAQALANAGWSTLRLSLPSTGDSGGDVETPARLQAWITAVGASAAWLRETTDADRLVAVGMQLGGMLACSAVAEGAPIDDLVLWATPARGRTLIRRLRAFARLEAETFFQDLPQPPPAVEAELEAGGFRMAAETVAAVETIDLTSVQIDGVGRRVLLLGQDGVGADRALAARLASVGAELKTGTGDGYADMTSHPQTAQPATHTLEAVQQWLAAAPAETSASATTGAAVTMRATVPRHRLEDPAGSWRETPVFIPAPAGQLPGILTVPSDLAEPTICAVLLNTGAVRRIGPSRIWVETARRWAGRGVPSLRLDIEGIGDGPGAVVAYPDDSGFHRPEPLEQVRCALDHLQRSGVADRFILAGLCSGAYWAFWLSVQDPRVTAVALVNQRVVLWDEDLAPARYVRRLLSERPSLRRIRRVATPGRIAQILRWLLATGVRRALRRTSPGRATAGPERSAVGELARLGGSGVQATFVFAAREPLEDEIVASGMLDDLIGSGAVRLRRIPVSDHTLRPGFAQAMLGEMLDEALERALPVSSADG